MLFQEKKIKEGYWYRVQDIFGEAEIRANKQLDKETLDEIVSGLLKLDMSAGLIEGNDKDKKRGLEISYQFKPAPMWSDDDEDDKCENIPTSTSEPEKEYIPTKRSMTKIISWLRRFVVAFLEAFKKA
ncbi:hypothetical protein DRQ25_00975 [Candidatus Fermentibacteria bacterium]|nr:MAG: hypothetical protein DRQ25_00975 [Candidatus Fermentibacteria bacterium]